MKNVTASSLSLNMDRISSASKNSSAPVRPDRGSLRIGGRESFFDPSGAFVEVDGKRYYLDAPRGTYLNILV